MKVIRLLLTVGVFQLLMVASLVARGDELLSSDAQVEYQWQRPGEEVRHLFDQIVLLRYGDQYSKVMSALGTPSDYGTVGDKNPNNRTRDSKFLTYATKRVRPEGGNMYDQEISLYFDQQDRLYEIAYSGLRPLSGRITSKMIQAGVEFYSTEPPLR